jgi:hypothetical protein
VKLLIFLLSAYFIALSALPCGDGNSLAAPTQKESPQSEKGKTAHDDSCSPFCACACCGMTLSNYSPAHFFHISGQIAAFVKPEPHYRCGFISSYHQSIWQPPQLS